MICARAFADSSIFTASAAAAEALERLRIDPRIVPVRLQEGLGHALGDGHVEIVAAEEAVAGRCQHLEHVPGEVEQRAVERAAAEVVDRDPLLAGPTEAVGERRGRRLVDDAKDIEPRDAPCDLGRGPLQLVEVGGNGDDGALDPLAEGPLGDLLGAA